MNKNSKFDLAYVDHIKESNHLVTFHLVALSRLAHFLINLIGQIKIINFAFDLYAHESRAEPSRAELSQPDVMNKSSN